MRHSRSEEAPEASLRFPLQPGPEGNRSFPREPVIARGAINQVNIHLFIETMPLEGRNSGIGHYYGKAALTLSRTRNRFLFAARRRHRAPVPPYTEEKVKALSQWFEY